MSEGALALAIGSKALDGLSMRMSALAWNTANVNSPNVRPLKVDFESALARAAQSGVAAVEDLELTYSAGPPFAPGQDRRMDLLIADAAQTAMRYSALSDMLGRRLALASAAMGGQG